MIAWISLVISHCDFSGAGLLQESISSIRPCLSVNLPHMLCPDGKEPAPFAVTAVMSAVHAAEGKLSPFLDSSLVCLYVKCPALQDLFARHAADDHNHFLQAPGQQPICRVDSTILFGEIYAFQLYLDRPVLEHKGAAMSIDDTQHSAI